MNAVIRIHLKGSVSLSGIRDIGDSLERLDTGSSLSISELFSVNSLPTVAVKAKTCGHYNADEDGREAGESQDDLDSPEPLFVGLRSLAPLSSEVKRYILSEDGVADDVSPELSHVRHPMKVTADHAHTQLNFILDSNRSYLQDAAITMRDGRYCLPVKSEYKNQVSRIIHDQPAMSPTLFVEPMIIIRLNNEMQELEIQEQKEVEAVLASLNNQTAPYMGELRTDTGSLAQLDSIFAKAGLARHYKCSAPMFNDKGCIHIRDGRHPLLNPQFVASIDVWLDRESDPSIVTSPNTDGRTAPLRTVGLFTLMRQSGFHIPAWEGLKLVAFDQVLTDTGDEQSIEQNLSTFPVYMTNTVHILSEADSRSLCLLDELGAGTDPTEGAALAITILSFLRNMKYRIMATTHYSELRVFTLSTPGVENACCGFNVEILQPTYRPFIGVPGESNVFAIPQKPGPSGYTIDDVEPHLEAKDEPSEDLLISLESSRLTIEREQAGIDVYKGEIVSLKIRPIQREERLGERKNKTLKNATEETQRTLREAKETTDQTIKQINRLAASSGMGKELEAKHARLRDQLKKTGGKLVVKPKGSSQPVSLKKLKIGDGVKVLSMNLRGVVSTLPNAKGDLYVQMGILRSLVDIRGLELLSGEDISAALGDGSSISYDGKTARGKGSGSSRIKMSEPFTVSAEVNFMGVAVDEAAPTMEKYPDNTYLTRPQTMCVVHGRETGAPKNIMYKHLCWLKYVKGFCSDQLGGDDSGVTVMTFK